MCFILLNFLQKLYHHHPLVSLREKNVQEINLVNCAEDNLPINTEITTIEMVFLES